MTSLLIHNASVVLPSGAVRGGVLVRNSHVADVFSEDQVPTGMSRAETIDLGGALLAPGLIDIHIHGSAGVDVQATDGGGFTKLSEFLLSEGVTGYFPTLVPTDERGYVDAVEAVRAHIEHQDGGKLHHGARILGIHFEGPFVSERRCGALRPRYFRSYDGDARSIDVFAGRPREDGTSRIIRLMTLAPEVRGGLDLTRALVSQGVRVFIGHSEATPDLLDLAAEAGARHITHFPNALNPLHHRKPGAVGWGLVRPDVTVDCIADLHHVHALMLRLIFQTKGADGMALISDAIMPAGLGDGEYSVWGEKIAVKDGRTALARKPGESTIAGSVITMRQALKNIAGLGVPIHEVVRMATLVPARAARIDSQYGSIQAGKRADLIALGEDLSVRLALIGGEPQRS